MMFRWSWLQYNSGLIIEQLIEHVTLTGQIGRAHV